MEREIIEKLDYIISILKPAHDIPDIIKIYLQHKYKFVQCLTLHFHYTHTHTHTHIYIHRHI